MEILFKAIKITFYFECSVFLVTITYKKLGSKKKLDLPNFLISCRLSHYIVLFDQQRWPVDPRIKYTVWTQKEVECKESCFEH